MVYIATIISAGSFYLWMRYTKRGQKWLEEL